MRPILVIVHQPCTNFLASLSTVFKCAEINALILQTSPKSFDKHVIHPPAFSIHRDFDIILFQYRDEIKRCELRSLIRIKNIWPAI
jgi:hypothetical protein